MFFSKSFSIGTRPTRVVNVNALQNITASYNADIANAANFGNNIPSNGSAVTPWADSLGTGKDLNKSGSNALKPIWVENQSGIGNTFGIVRFDGSNDSLDINPIAWMQSLSGFSLFVVAKATTVGVSTRTLCTTDTGGFQISHNSSNWRVEAGGCSGVSTVTGVGDTSKFNIYALIFDGSGIGNTGRLKFRYNKIPQTLTYVGTANSITSASASRYYVGVGSAANSQYFSGDIAQILIFNRALDSTRISGVESYLSTKWNL